MHDQMAGLLRLAHHMKHHVALGNIKIGVDLHPALVGMGRHGIPDGTGLQLGQSHGQLAGFQHIGMDKLIDDPLVGGLHRAAGTLVGVLHRDEGGLADLVGGRGNQIKPGGVSGILAGKADGFGLLGNIQAILKAQLILHTVGLDDAGAAQIEYAGLPALQEIVGAEVGPNVDPLIDGDRLVHRQDAQHNHPVHMGVDGGDLIGLIEVFDEELIPQFLGCIALHVPLVGGITNIHRILLTLSASDESGNPRCLLQSRSRGPCRRGRAPRCSHQNRYPWFSDRPSPSPYRWCGLPHGPDGPDIPSS
ncbi:hypothetical protein SDC9_87013 [bioreactor metagenome]|uniref:Uncharacterized protein n=1 Tax=bioreactor metagenome TaxID=1076179 RepID=A0A644ZNU7_9ZZZZ